MSEGFAARLAAALGEDAAGWAAPAREELEAALAEQLAHAGRSWAPLALPAERFLDYLAARLDLGGARGPAAVAAALERIEIADLYLCCGCAGGEAAALGAFERAFGGEIERAAARVDASGDLAAEVRQALRHELFVAAPGQRPRIERYLGRGPLGRWLWVMATREALMARRRTRRETALGEAHLGIADVDLELDYLKREYRAAFREAFTEAMAELPSKQRNLLDYHFIQHLTIDQIGALYRVHRVTAFRWLRSARAELLAATRRQLAARLHIAPSEVDSILRLVQSRLEVSVERLLGG